MRKTGDSDVVSARKLGDLQVTRRAVTTAAWAAPVVAMAVAIPQAAASGERVDLWSTARLPLNSDGTRNGYAFYDGPRDCSFEYTFGNNGPDPLPAGATITIGLPFAAIWENATMNITSSGGRTLTPAGTGTAEIGQNPLAIRRLFYFTLADSLPAGAFFNVNFTIRMNDTSNTATDFWRVRTTSNFTVPTGTTDTDTGNNADYSDNFALFNHSGGSTNPDG